MIFVEQKNSPKIAKIDFRFMFDDNLPKRTKIWRGKVERDKNQGSKPTNNGQPYKVFKKFRKMLDPYLKKFMVKERLPGKAFWQSENS